MAVAAVSKCGSNVSVQGFQGKRFQFFEMVDVWSSSTGRRVLTYQ